MTIEKYIHTADGKLKVDDPFKVSGTVVRCKSRPNLVGVITERALGRYTDESSKHISNAVWAVWSHDGHPPENPDGRHPTYVSRSDCEVVDGN